jgi:hypothetical protein
MIVDIRYVPVATPRLEGNLNAGAIIKAPIPIPLGITNALGITISESYLVHLCLVNKIKITNINQLIIVRAINIQPINDDLGNKNIAKSYRIPITILGTEKIIASNKYALHQLTEKCFISVS